MAQILYSDGGALRRVYLPTSTLTPAVQAAQMLAAGRLSFSSGTQHLALADDHPAAALPLSRLTVNWQEGTVTIGEAPPPPPPEVPAEVTMRQARLALHAAGLLSSVEAAIDALPDPPRSAARIEWDHSQTVQRNRGIVQQLGTALGMTSAQLDALFIAAAAIP